MNILIDGCIFVDPETRDCVEFWRIAVPKLPSLLPMHVIFLLNREIAVRFPAAHNLRNLHAPPPEWERSAIEDRRLAALCRELSVDVFASTYYTSAGGYVRSLSVSVQPDAEVLSVDPLRNAWVAASRQRAANLATWNWTLCPGEVTDPAMLTEDLARALIQAGTRLLSQEEETRRIAEEDLTAQQAGQLQEAELQHFIAVHQAHHDRQAHGARTVHGALGRAYWSVRQPHRYREYAIRILERLGLRRG